MLTWTKLEPGAYPKDGELILAVMGGNMEGYRISGTFYRDSFGYGFQVYGGDYLYPVTHWMPLPPLPKEPAK